MSYSNASKKYFVKAVLSSVLGTASPDAPDGVDFDLVYSLAVRNSAQVMLYYAAKGKETEYAALLPKLEKAYKVAVVREINQQSEIERIKKDFSENGIDFMLLKGSHLKALYPANELRFMVDMDVLVKKEDVQKASEIILSHGLEKEMNNGKDIVFIKKPFLTVELHNTLFCDDFYMYDYFLSVWDRAQKLGKNEYKMSYNDLYVYAMAHLAEHYLEGGSCFRPVIDILLLNLKKKDKLDFEYINEQFCLLGISDFAENIKKLGECWLGSGETDETLSLMENYILLGPPVKEAFVSAKSENAGKSKLRILLSAAFPGLEHMKRLFPTLEKFPCLLPVFWLARIFKNLFKIETKRKFDSIKNADPKDAEIMREIYKKSGL